MAPACVIQMASPPAYPSKPKQPSRRQHHRHHHAKAKPDAEQLVKDMVGNLSSKELEVAARTSYHYYITSEQGNASEDERERQAKSMAKRHLIAEKHHVQKATRKLKKTIQYRTQYNVDGIRRAFQDENSTVRKGIENQLEDGEMFIRGHDKEHRAILHVIPRNANAEKYKDPVGYVNSYIYLMERALACTERASNGQHEMVNVMVDFAGYDKEHAPPIKLAKELLFLLGDHYPERLHRVYLIDAPGIFRAFWTIMKPFIDPVTKLKFQFITGEKEKLAAFEPVIGLDQAMPYMLPKGKLDKPIDMRKFLEDTPYDCALDEI